MDDTIRQMGQKSGVDSQSRVEMEGRCDQLGARIEALMLEVEYAKKRQESNDQTTPMQPQRVSQWPMVESFPMPALRMAM